MNYKEIRKYEIKTLKRKRLIANMVIGLFVSGFIVSGSTLVFGGLEKGEMTTTLKDLENKKSSIINTYMSSDEFKSEFDSKYQQYTDAYTSGVISYDEYEQKLNYLNSQEFVTGFMSNESKKDFETLNSDINDFNQQCDDLTNISTIAGYGIIGCGVGIIPATIVKQDLDTDYYNSIN